MERVLLPSSSPIVSFRIVFTAGASLDPQGKLGVARLTAAMIAEGGTRTRTYEEIVRAMYPMATNFFSQVDKEMSVFGGQTHIDNLQAYYRLIVEMLTDPGWREDDFKRLKEDAINFLKINLRENNDEELGKELLYNFIYSGTSYGHANAGTITSLEQLTLADVREFYLRHYNQSNLVLGLSGGYSEEFSASVQAEFAAKLPTGAKTESGIPEPAPISGLE
ncbi:MAG: M16 family metallopeptidase, partial [Blastocatellia bacterium]